MIKEQTIRSKTCVDVVRNGLPRKREKKRKIKYRLIFTYLSHHLTRQCFGISEDLHRFARNLQHLSTILLFFIVPEQF